MPNSYRTYSKDFFALRLNGHDVTLPKKVEGGDISAQVQHTQGGRQYYLKKHIGKPEYEDFSVQIDGTMSQALYDWIAASWRGRAPKRNGAVLWCDNKLAILTEHAFSNALITETAFPALDASSKEPAYLNIRFRPESITTKKGTGKLTLGSLGKQALWLTSNFRLEIDGLQTDTIKRIDSFAIKRTSGPEPAKIDFPDLKVSIGQQTAQSWIDWHADFLVKGNNDDKHEKNGKIRFLAPDLKTELARVELHNLGIFRLSTESGVGSQAGLIIAELYCEWMEFYMGGVNS
jgi:hypothetical protein